MKLAKNKRNGGFSLLELMVSMSITLGTLGLITSLFSAALGTRERESRKTDALSSARASINIMSREIANAGYGLKTNGIVLSDSNQNKIRIRANLENMDSTINSPGEDIAYFYDASTSSVVRFDPNDNPQTSVVINRISTINFKFYDYHGSSSTSTQQVAPTNQTGRVRITATVQLEPVQGQPDNQVVTFTSDVTLRNSNYMRNQY